MRKLLSFLMAFVMLMSLAACGTAEAPVEETAPATEAETVSVTETETSYYPITLIDQAGREVTIEEEPRRLISAYYITSSLLISLDVEDRMVGIENDPEKRAVYGLSAPELLQLPTVGTAKELDMEVCASLEPDLLILPMKLKNSVETLEALGMKALLVDPEDQQRLAGMIELVGKATNREETARQLLSFIEKKQAFLEDALAEVEKPSVYLAGNSSMLKTAGDAMYQADMIRLGGGANVASAIEDTYWAEISYEQLLTWDPEYIILAAEATYTVEDVLADPNLASCTAVVQGNVYRLPNKAEAWDSPVPGSILGALWLANILHPEQVSDADCVAGMDEFYETFYQFTYSEK